MSSFCSLNESGVDGAALRVKQTNPAPRIAMVILFIVVADYKVQSAERTSSTKTTCTPFLSYNQQETQLWLFLAPKRSSNAIVSGKGWVR